MTREDRELLAELARLNTDMVSLAMRIVDQLASADEQAHYAHRLIAAGKRLQRRVNEMGGAVIEGEVVLTNGPLTLPGLTAEPNREP
jgi:phosphomevalonate kinase